MWTEGMFLRPHHFQLQDARTESLVAMRARSVQPYAWGFAKLRLNKAALDNSEIALESCVGALRNDMPFALPGDIAAPGDPGSVPTLPLGADGEEVINQTIWLCAPSGVDEARLAAPPKSAHEPVSTRYAILSSDHRNVLDDNAAEEPVQMGAPNLSLFLGETLKPGYIGLRIGRVREITQDKEIVLDPDFIPTVLSADASKNLMYALENVVRLLELRAEEIDAYGTAGGASASGLKQLVLLQLLNRWTGRLRQILDAEKIHPLELHRELSAAASEFVTFAEEGPRRPEPFPKYDHDDLTGTFQPVFASLRRSLSGFGEQKEAKIELQENKDRRVHFARQIDGTLYEKARWILVVNAPLEEEELRTDFPKRTSVASVGEMRKILGSAVKGVKLKPVGRPDELQPMRGWQYFELVQDGPSWEQMIKEGSVAIHPQKKLGDVKIELWAIKD